MKRTRRFSSCSRFRTLSLAGALATTLARNASAQQNTFHLDRLEVPGAPEDGTALFRPLVQPRTIAYGQIAVGYSRNPLHTSNIVSPNAQTTLSNSTTGAIQNQLTFYGSAGLQFLNRFTVGVTFPLTAWQTGNVPNYQSGTFGSVRTTTFDPDGAHANPTRIDARAVLLKSNDDKMAFGVQGSLFAPTGDAARFGGDGQTTGLLMGSFDYDLKLFSLGANLGVHFRPQNSVNSPAQDYGLGIGDELRWAVGGFVPFKGGKYRVGGTLMGQFGIESNTIIGDTFGKKRNTPIEWHAEGRMRLGEKDRYWIGFGGGALIGNGYGAPDMRLVALAGMYVPLTAEAETESPDAKLAQREKWRHDRSMEKGAFEDDDGDGIPNEVDACPKEPEDHEPPDPTDGCPKPPDRDGDGIIDSLDKCPDQAEDKDGIDDADGCPEDDADHDGVPDVQDACPHEPGQPSPDPTKNGCPQFIHLENGKITILQQVHFATGKAQILADSFGMLQEIAGLLKANPGIKKVSIDGHTDNRGNADKNEKLSQSRADAVKTWLSQHGVEDGRLVAHGFGQTKPIADNNTDKGRASNRRVEFNIAEQEAQ